MQFTKYGWRPAVQGAIGCFVLLIGTLWGAPTAYGSAFETREKYKSARDQLWAGQIKKFRATSAELEDYVLYPYLEYYDLNRRLGSVKPDEINAFRSRYPTLPAADRLYSRWLRHLGQARRTTALLEHFEPTTSAELNCLHLRALYRSGKREEALSQTAEIWSEPKSQPKACDPLFTVWRDSKYFTQQVVWQRYQGALNANERSLARYVQRYFKNANPAQRMYDVHVSPTRLTTTGSFATDSKDMRRVIEHGLARLARRDATKAWALWKQFRRSHSFDIPDTLRIHTTLHQALAREGVFPSDEDGDAIVSPDAIENIALAAVRNENWPETSRWIRRMPPEMAAKAQWQYWLGRAESVNGLYPEEFSSVATRRTFYGFMAAKLQDLPDQMNAAQLSYDAALLEKVRRHPNVARGLELFAIGDNLNARREWYAALQNLPPEEQLIAGEIAASNGLTRTAIRAANSADATDYLHLRFPVAHEAEFRQASLKTGLPLPLLFAIARQESAMDPKAKSHANARGLMQLLPSTARIVARRARLSQPDETSLYDPATNIALGSYHMAWLIKRYNGQSPLAIAAYNAGEHRVDRWIKEAQDLPMDVWIERIPFKETRNYVKNVLAFKQVYANRLNMSSEILETHEQKVIERS